MSEKQLFIECIPKIEEMAVEFQEMTAWQYLEFKREHLEEVRRSYPKALGFMKKIYAAIEMCLAG